MPLILNEQKNAFNKDCKQKFLSKNILICKKMDNFIFLKSHLKGIYRVNAVSMKQLITAQTTNLKSLNTCLDIR